MDEETTEKDGYWLAGSCLLFAALLLLREWTIWRLSGGLYGTYSVSPSVFSEVNSWLPLAHKVAHGNLFPASPSIDAAEWGLRFYPYLSLWLHGALIALFGVPGAYLVGHTLFPIGSFCLLFLLFRRFLTVSWSVTLCFFALISFVSLPFRDFLLAVLKGSGWREMVTYEPLAVTNFTSPAFSLFSFLGVFYLSSQKKKLTFGRTTWLTVLWALQSQVHVVNAVVGLSFWFLSVPVRWRRQNPGAGNADLAKFWLCQAAIAFAVLSPALWAYSKLDSRSGVDFISLSGASPDHEAIFGPFYYFTYFVAPLALILVVYLIERVDPYEFLFRFRSVYALLAIELALCLAYGRVSVALPPSLVFSRLGLFFLHIYYFVPVVYFLQRPPREFHAGVESLRPLRYLRLGMGWLFTAASQVYLPVLIILFCLFGAASELRQVRHFKDVELPALRGAWADLEELKKGAPVGAVLVSKNPAVNLLIPIASDNGTLWVNRFSNRVPHSEVVERFALHARIFGWTEAEFSAFMNPGPLQWWTRRDPVKLGCGFESDVATFYESCFAPAGVGYWLTMHHAQLSPGDLRRYQDEVIDAFKNVDLAAALRRFGVRRILADQPLALPGAAPKKTNQGMLYEF